MAGSDTRDVVSREQLAEENAVPVCAATARDISRRYYSTHYLGTPWFPFVVDPSSLAHCDRCANEAQPDVGSVWALFLRSLRPSCMLARADMVVFVKGAWASTGAVMWGAFANLGTTSVGAAAVCAPLGPGAAVCTPIVAVLLPRGCQGAGPQERPPMCTTPKYEGKCFSSNGGHSEGVFLLRGRQPLRFRRLVGLLSSRSYRARNPVEGLCLEHAPGPALWFCVNGSRGRAIKNRSV
jgi:hypothetical protein